MISFEHTDVVGWKHAIQNISAKGYRKTKNGRYETFVSNHSKTINLGTYNTIEEARDAVLNYRLDRFASRVKEYGLNPNDGIVYEDNYVVFDNGMIFNLHGERMRGGINRSGYRQGIFNGRNRNHHKIIAECFIPNPENLRDVDHKNGNKLDIQVGNLERVTHSENVKRAYDSGLIQKQCGEDHYAHKLTKEDVEYIRSVYSKRDPDHGATALARKFGVDRTTIHDVVREKTWRY